MQPQNNAKLYFPNLNGVRFIAACFVIINHVEQLKLFYGIGAKTISQSVKLIGKLGVMLFFVLSGFLITYLLLSEEKLTQKIHVKKFYIRRFLRIVPLYFLLLFLVFFVIPNGTFFEIPNLPSPIENDFSIIFILHVLFLPNLVTAMYGFLPYIAQAWSIGTEQQAYLIFPVLLRNFKKNRIRLFLGIIVFYFLVRIILSSKVGLDFPHKHVIASFWSHFNIDVISVGGIFAVLLFEKHWIVSKLTNITLFFVVLFTTIFMLYVGVKIPFFHYLGYAILFGIIILNLAVNKQLKNVLEWRFLSYLGQISYGIYMCHFIIMILVLMLAKKYTITTNWFMYPLTLAGSILISSFSYHYFEGYFLKLKTKFTFVKSGGSNF